MHKTKVKFSVLVHLLGVNFPVTRRA